MARTDKVISAYGTWHVTTEGDCEGRTTRDLGTHTGWLDEIAFKLADKSYYGLRFSQVDPQDLDHVGEKDVEVNVSLDIGTGTWDLHGEERSQYFRKMLDGRDVQIEEGQYYATVKMFRGKSSAARERARVANAKAAALAKLTVDERALLGL